MFNLPGVRKVRIVLALIILSAVPAFGLTMHDRTNSDVTFEWTNSDTRTQWFEVRLRSLDLSTPPFIATETTRIPKDVFTGTLKKPRSGNWAVEVRACAKVKYECVNGVVTSTIGAEGTEEICSDWQQSDVVGEPAPWAVTWKPPSVFNINIDDYATP